MKRIYILILLPLLAMVPSCKNYLDIKPYGKTIPTTADEFASLLHTRLNEIDYGLDETLVGNISTVASLEYYADNLDANLTIYPGGNSIPIYVGSQLNNKQTRYANIYARIRDCNIIIGNLKTDNNPEDKKVLGTAYAIRGISYFNLLREYAEPFQRNDQLGLPLVTEFNMEEKPLRSTYGETVSLIEQDLKKAIAYQVDDELFRFTEDVTRAYLARLYFWTKNWNKSIEEAAYLLQKHPMENAVAYKQMIQNKNVKQGTILLRSYIFNDNSADILYTSNMDILKLRPISKDFHDLFTEREQDVRYGIIFGEKRINKKNFFANVRTDEMCLILAEAYAHLGDENKALGFLNEIRSKRITNYTPYTSTNLPAVKLTSLIFKDATGTPLSPLMQAILNERRKELYGEGDRWFELKRNGRPTFWVASNGRKYTTEQFMYTFPIPGVDIQIIPGLVQNPGYGN
jgi:hypothetical protein